MLSGMNILHKVEVCRCRFNGCPNNGYWCQWNTRISKVRTECHSCLEYWQLAGLVERHTPGEDNFYFNLQQNIKGHIDFRGKQSRYFLRVNLSSNWMDTKKLYLWTPILIILKSTVYVVKHPHKQLNMVDPIKSEFLCHLSVHQWETYIGRCQQHQAGIASFQLPIIFQENVRITSHSQHDRKSTTMDCSQSMLETSALFSCTWEYADGQTMQYRGVDGVFENSLWHHNDFTCVGVGQLFS